MILADNVLITAMILLQFDAVKTRFDYHSHAIQYQVTVKQSSY